MPDEKNPRDVDLSIEDDTERLAEMARIAKETKERNVPDYLVCDLELDRNGRPLRTIDNFLKIMRADPFYQTVRFNVLKDAPEVLEGGRLVRWQDANSAMSKHYIETIYGLYHATKHEDALSIIFKERSFHPVQEILDPIKWDGVNRIESFLTRWMGAADTQYTREVARLIFAQGINRIYEPGGKCDLIPVLIGTRQGEGKSSMVRWLALKDEFFGVVNQFDDQKSMEQMQGIWIGEVGELLALSRARELESIKEFITRQVDRWRKPYGKYLSESPRRAILIGTTNNRWFLSDKTGNRRFAPVEVYCNGYTLFSHEVEIREEIKQCWAEARDRYQAGNMPAYVNPALEGLFAEAQEAAMEDDWRIGKIHEILSRRSVGDLVCVRQIRQALYADTTLKEDRKESREIGQILDMAPGWSRMPTKARPTQQKDLGAQNCWRKD